MRGLHRLPAKLAPDQHVRLKARRAFGGLFTLERRTVYYDIKIGLSIVRIAQSKMLPVGYRRAILECYPWTWVTEWVELREETIG